jgi:hypothetical protein
MAQHDYVIDNSTGANVRADINNVLQAIATNNSGSSAPSTTVATQFFADTSAGILKLRNTANSGYVNLFTLAGGVDVDAASNFNEDVTFTGATSGRNIVFDKSDNALEFLDNSVCKFGTDGDGDIFHDGTDLFIRETDSGQLLFRADGQHVFANSAGSENRILTVNNGAVQLFFDHSKKFETLSDGVRITSADDSSTGVRGDFLFQQTDGTTVATFDSSASTLLFEDNRKAVFGTGSDLEIFHSGSHSFIKDTGTGQLVLNTNAFRVNNAADSENLLTADENGAVSLFYDDSKKFETQSTGVKITNVLQVGDDAGSLLLGNNEGFSPTFTENAGGLEFRSNNSKRFTFTHGGDMNFENNRKLAFGGTNQAMQLYHDGSNAYVDVGTGAGVLHLRSADDIKLQTNMSELMVKCDENAAVELYYDGAGPKFETESTGVLVAGKYRQESSGGNKVYAQQVFRESIAANTTKTFTITGMAYGNVKLTMGFGDGNFHYAAFAAVLGGNMYSVGNAYAAAQLLNDRSGVNSITVTKSNSSYAVAIHAGTNQIFGSVVVESNGYDTHSGVTLTIS